MSASRGPSPQRRRFDEQFCLQNDRLQIRIVPYSPPRLSSEGSQSPRPVSGADCSPPPGDNGDNGLDQVNALGIEGSYLRGGPTCLDTTSVNITSPHHDAVFCSHSERQCLSPSTSIPTPPSPSISVTSQTPSPLRRHRIVINVHSDKTFSLLPQSNSISSQATSSGSFGISSTIPSSTYSLLPSLLTDELSHTPATPKSQICLDHASPVSATPGSDADMQSYSPWNYRLVGGLRKVPGPKRSPSPENWASSTLLADQTWPAEGEAGPSTQAHATELTSRPSFRSSISCSTSSEKTNYKVYAKRPTSPLTSFDCTLPAVQLPAAHDMESRPPSSSHSNYHVFGESSSSNESLDDRLRPGTNESEANYIVHDNQSRSSSIATFSKRPLRAEYSRESLKVAPLRPVKEYPSKPEPLPQCELGDAIQGASLVYSAPQTSDWSTVSHITSGILPGKVAAMAQISRGSPAPVSSPIGLDAPDSHQHQWSSQLSTILSESEVDSRSPSRSLSPLNDQTFRVGGSGRHASAPIVRANEPAYNLEKTLPALPSAVHQRESNRELTYDGTPLVRDQDEDGDGLTDLTNLYRLPNRKWHSNKMSSHQPDRNLRPASRSRANSLNYSAIPAWARLYYGSSNRRLLVVQPSLDSISSQFTAGRPTGSFLSRPPTAEPVTETSYSSHLVSGATVRCAQGNGLNAELGLGATSWPIWAAARGLKKQTSSIWSPHLRRDKRSQSTSLCHLPFASSCPNSSPTNWWNMQVVLFIVGFAFPLAWMVAAILPLPHPPNFIDEVHSSWSKPDFCSSISANLDARHFYRTRWWRAINRRMAILGLILIGAAIILVVIGIQQQWRRT